MDFTVPKLTAGTETAGSETAGTFSRKKKKMRLATSSAAAPTTHAVPKAEPVAAPAEAVHAPRKKVTNDTLFSRELAATFANARKLPSTFARPDVSITTEEFMGEMLERQAHYTTKRPSWIVPTDNVTTPICDFFQQNAAVVASVMPLKTDSFDLTPGQVATAFFLAFGIPQETSFFYTIDEEKVKDYLQSRRVDKKISVSLMESICKKVSKLKEKTFGSSLHPKHHPGGIKIACMPTGTGKTTVCLAAAISYLFTERGRKRAKSVINHIKHDPKTGVRFESSVTSSEVEKARFAPLIIVFAPAHLMNNWVNTANSFKKEVRRLYREGVYASDDLRVWKGTPKDEIFSIKRVAEDQVETIWVLSEDVKYFDVLYEHNAISYSCMIGDEMVSNLAKRNTHSPSTPGLVLIAQATMRALERFINRKNTFLETYFSKGSLTENRDLNDLLEGEEMTTLQTTLMMGSKMVMCMLPDVLLQACATQAVEHMPKGIQIFKMKADNTSIYEVLASGSLSEGKGADLNALTREYFTKVLRSVRYSASPTDFSFITVDEDNGNIIIDFEGMLRVGQETLQCETAYQVLGMNSDEWMDYSSSNEKFQAALKAAVKKRRFETHPDKNLNNTEEATLQFQKVEAAAESLLHSKGFEDRRVLQSTREEEIFKRKMEKLTSFSHCSNENCPGGKMVFSTNSKTCVTCGNSSATTSAVSLENLQPGESSFQTNERNLLRKVIEKCLTNHMRILMFCHFFNESFFEGFDCELVPLVEEAVTDFTKKRKRGPNYNKKAQLVDKFCTEPKPQDKPMVLILGEKELIGTDFHGAEALIVYGGLSSSYHKQLQGRVLRMNKNMKERSFVNVYEFV